MKHFKTFFGEDKMSAILSLAIFVCSLLTFVSHLFKGVGAFALFIEVLICAASFGLVSAVYSENKKEMRE